MPVPRRARLVFLAAVSTTIGLHGARGWADASTCRPAAECEKLCTRGDAAACVEAGNIQLDGRGVPQSPTRAVTFFRSGCDRGSARACATLGLAYETGFGAARDYARSAEAR